jgi:hypothetical protein
MWEYVYFLCPNFVSWVILRRILLETYSNGLILLSSTAQDSNADHNLADSCVVADECHMIKEKKSAITEAMNEVNSLCRIGLTGTAIQK